MTDLKPGQLRIGEWLIQEESPPIPCWVFSAVHDDYDGAPDSGDHRSIFSTRPRSTGILGRLAALQDVLDQMREQIEETIRDCPI